MIKTIREWDNKIHYYDKLNGRDLEEHIVKKRLKSGLKPTICVYMMYKVFENLTKRENDFKTKLEVIYTACNDERVFEIQKRIGDLLREMRSEEL